MNYDLIGDYVDVVVGGTASLSAFYYCNWSLNVDPDGRQSRPRSRHQLQRPGSPLHFRPRTYNLAW